MSIQDLRGSWLVGGNFDKNDKVFETKDRATISELSELTNTNINTIKKHLSNLVGNNYLTKHGKTRGAWYTKSNFTNL